MNGVRFFTVVRGGAGPRDSEQELQAYLYSHTTITRVESHEGRVHFLLSTIAHTSEDAERLAIYQADRINSDPFLAASEVGDLAEVIAAHKAEFGVDLAGEGAEPKGYEITHQVTGVDQYGRAIISATLSFNDTPVAALVARPEADAHHRHVACGVSYGQGFDRHHESIASGGLSTPFAEAPTAEQVAQRGLDETLDDCGFAYGRYGERGEIPALGDVFLRAVERGAKYAHRSVRGGKLTGVPAKH